MKKLLLLITVAMTLSISVSAKKLDEIFMDYDFNTVRRVYSKVVPVKIEYDYAAEKFRVTALSGEFDSVNAGEPIPYYVVTITKPEDENEEIKIKFVRT